MISPRRAKGPRRRRLVASVDALEPRQLMSADVLTYRVDNTRSGANLAETTLTPANVNASTFGKVGFLATDGPVDAQPLYKAGVSIPGRGVHDVVIVATENDSVYAFDAHDGSTLWHAGPQQIAPGEVAPPYTDFDCNQVAPTVGITATPVIDPSTNTLYVEAMSRRIVDGYAYYYQRLHALDLSTGLDKVAPKAIDQAITYPGKGPGGDGSVVSFDPRQYVERDALTLSNGVVYTAWSSHCDHPPYTGWVIGFRASDLGLAAVLNIDPNGTPAADNGVGESGGTSWNSGGGAAVDAAGNLYNISGNGPFDPSSGDYGDAYLKLSTANGGLTVADYFAPSNQQQLSDDDIDLGSSGVTILPDVVDASGNVRHLIVGSGKDGNIYLLDRDDLGGYSTTSNRIVQQLSGTLGGALFSTPAYFNGSVYFGPVGSTIKAFSVGGGGLSTAPTSATAHSFGYPGASVSISASGTANGIAWAAENGPVAGLYAFDASDLSRELYDSNQSGDRDHFGAGEKFITPTVADGRVFVGTQTGVGVFGLLNPTSTSPPATTPTPAAPPSVLLGAFASPTFVVGGFDQLAAVGADAAFGESGLTYTWSTLIAPAGAPTPSFSQNGTNASKLVGVGIAAPGIYAFRVTIQAPDGQSATSDLGVLASLPSPVVVVPAFAGATRTVGGTVLLAAGAVDQAFAPTSLSYSWSTLQKPAGAASPTFAANNSRSAGLTGFVPQKAGTYVFLVTIANPFGVSTTSTVSVTVAARPRRR